MAKALKKRDDDLANRDADSHDSGIQKHARDRRIDPRDQGLLVVFEELIAGPERHWWPDNIWLADGRGYEGEPDRKGDEGNTDDQPQMRQPVPGAASFHHAAVLCHQ